MKRNIDLSPSESLVLFIGGPRHRILQAFLDNQILISKVFIPKVENPKLAETIEMCKKHQLDTEKISKNQLKNFFPGIQGKACFSLGFPYLFPKEFIEQTKFIINVHGTLLPRYRGACTLNWVIENGEQESGVTVHFVDEGCDTGDIILQKSFPLSIFETGKSLYRKTLEFEPKVVLEALQLLYKGTLEVSPQENFSFTSYENRNPSHSEIDPQKSLKDLYNKIRAADPIHYPAHFFINGEKICIKLWRENKLKDEEDLI